MKRTKVRYTVMANRLGYRLSVSQNYKSRSQALKVAKNINARYGGRDSVHPRNARVKKVRVPLHFY